MFNSMFGELKEVLKRNNRYQGPYDVKYFTS